jgi:hypothetical protein
MLGGIAPVMQIWEVNAYPSRIQECRDDDFE